MFIRLFRQYGNMTEEDRLSVIARNGAIIAPALADMGNGARDFLNFFSAVCADNGKISTDEYKALAKAVDGLPEYGAAFEREVVRSLEESVEALSLLGDDEKSALVSLCLCFCAAGGKISRRAKRALKALIG